MTVHYLFSRHRGWAACGKDMKQSLGVEPQSQTVAFAKHATDAHLLQPKVEILLAVFGWENSKNDRCETRTQKRTS